MVLKNNNKICGMVYAFCLYTALMLFQTPVAKMGTIGAFGSMMLVIMGAIFGGKVELRKFRGSPEAALLFCFVILFFCTSYGHGQSIGFLVKAMVLILFSLILTGTSITKEEELLIRKTFRWATFVYAVLIINSCLKAGDNRYYHGDIQLFGTNFDPNFIGIPLVSASVLFLDEILRKGNKFVNVIALTTIVIAILYTSSRGNMLCLSVGLVSCFLLYLNNKEISNTKKFAWTVFILIAAPIVLEIIIKYFPDHWARMTDFGEGADNGRFDNWERAMRWFSKSPLWGNGYSVMTFTGLHAAHNTYLGLLCDTGLIGFFLYCSFLCRLLFKAYRYDRILAVVLMSMYVQIAFLDTISNRPVWVVLGWMILLPRQKRFNNQSHSYFCF